MVAAIPGTTRPSPAGEPRLLESREVIAGRVLQVWSASVLARSVRAGQYLHVLSPRTPGTLLPAVPVAGFDRSAGRLSLWLPRERGPARLLAELRPGDHARFEGPLGRGFVIDPRSRFLLVVTDVDGLARVRAIVDHAVTDGRQVTVLLGARSVATVPPSSLFPDEVEYVVATADGSLGQRGTVDEMLPAYEAWADQCFAAVEAPLLSRLLRLAAGRQSRMGVAVLGRRHGRRAGSGGQEGRRRAWLQVVLAHEAGCALGVCAGCVVGAATDRRICREGPAFAAGELDRARGS
jgi:NAD(P)H-flavin reductase